ncbi:MAG TPA: PLP-dependent aminotransferase family protein [Burkholderiales bacterium]
MRAAIAVDPSATTPLHRQIYEAWRTGILSGRFAGGTRLPSTRELARALAVSRSTVTQAYEQLIAEGYLQPVRGAGTFVCRELPDAALRARPQAPRAAASPAVRLSRFGAHLGEDFTPPSAPAGAVCFSRWGPDLERFPFLLWRRLLARQLRLAPRTLFDYARDTRGHEALRHEIAAYVARSRAVVCTPEQVIVVSGSQQALDLCARVLLEPGDRVAFEDPGYLGARRALLAHGARLEPVGIDAEGVRVADIRGRARLVYVTPSHQFPTGVAMSLARRLALIEWARRQRAVILEDDYDSEYRYSGSPLPALQSLAGDVPVVYCGTFSKVMFPALRIGYVVAPPALVPVLTRAKWLCDRHAPVLEQAALADFLREGHLERHVRRMRRLYGERRTVLVDALERHFGDRVAILGEPAGMHLLARFADGGIAERAQANKVHLRSSAAYYLTKAPRNEYAFGFSSLPPPAIREGVRRLAGAIARPRTL